MTLKLQHDPGSEYATGRRTYLRSNAWQNKLAPAHVFDSRSAQFLEETKARENLLTAVTDAQIENWDGEGARAVTALVEVRVQWILSKLPAGVPAPEISVDPDGELSLEWTRGPRLVFSASVGDHDTIAVAWINGDESFFGKMDFSLFPFRIRAKLNSIGLI